MDKFYFISCCLLLVLACNLTNAIENRRFRTQRLRQHPARPIFLARQELDNAAPEQAVTPYPSAAEIKPEVPFEEESLPEQVYGPPEQTYGPPEQTYGPPAATENVPAAEQLPSAESPLEFAPNPDAEEFEPVASSPARLTQAKRRGQRVTVGRLQAKPQRQQRVVKTQRLTVGAPPSLALPLVFPGPAHTSQQYFVVNQQPLGQLQTW